MTKNDITSIERYNKELTTKPEMAITPDGNRLVKFQNAFQAKIEYAVLTTIDKVDHTISYMQYKAIRKLLNSPTAKFVELPNGTILALHQIVKVELKQKTVETEAYRQHIANIEKEYGADNEQPTN